LKRKLRYIFLSAIGVGFWFFVFGNKVPLAYSAMDLKANYKLPSLPVDTPDNGDTLHYPLQQGSNNPNNPPGNSPLYLNDPSNVTSGVHYDPTTGRYVFTNEVGGIPVGESYEMSLEDYMKYDLQNSVDSYWKNRIKQDGLAENNSVIPKLHIGSKAFSTIFGSNTIDIRPQGSAELIFGVNSSKREDPSLDVKQQRVTNFDFQEKIQMNVRAKVGDKIDFGINYNTEANFEFDNKMKLAYQGDEDEILQLVEAGDVSMPLNTTLISGSQSLFGIKTKWQFGKTSITTIFSQQRSESKNITVSGGAQLQEFYIKADDYEENKHFFLSQYFRNHYNEALSTLPAINSGINITKVEVWITTIGAPVNENRNIVALMDLGEKEPYRTDVILPGTGNINGLPYNDANDLYAGLMNNSASVRDINQVSNYLSGPPYTMVAGRDFEKVENARRLSTTEYTINRKLGFISINSRLNSDQVLGVSYQYTLVGDTTVYQVGEFSDQGINAPQNLVVKLLKSTNVNTKVPTWDLMMKNVYSLQAYQITAEDFRLNVVYENPEFGVPTGFISEGAISGLPLISAMGLDNLNIQLDPVSDGVFDFIDGAATNGGTVESRNGRVFFPVLEPFGEDLRKAIDPDDPNSEVARKYAYDSLYTLTKHLARQYPDKNRFAMEGRYKSGAGSEISLNAMNVPQGSVKVTAGGVPLRENIDYTVDYTLGRVKIINEGILNSGTPINISLESNSMFNVQTKTLLGAHADYDFSKDLKLGATIMNLTERPLTQKVNTGDEPISNTIWGLDGSYSKDSRWLTKMIDKLPFIETKAPSTVSITGEFAHMIPGHPRALGKTGISYIDDFEGSSSGIDLMNVGRWKLASTPQGQTTMDMFPETGLNNSLEIGYNRAKLAWYVIDPLFVRNNNITPDHIRNDKDQQSNHYVREIFEKEVFPNKEANGNVPTNIPVLNLAYYPSERGQYNFDVEPSGISKGINADGTLKSPETRWAGIMRQIESTDFTATNIEYIEFWLMDPFIDPDEGGPQQGMQDGGDLYFNLGDVSEDILRDGRKSFENGLPISATPVNVDTTVWGLVPTLQALTNSFDNNPDSRAYQDVGYDGLRDEEERNFYQDSYLNRIVALYGSGSQAYINASDDPSNDDYHYFRGTDYDNGSVSILDRYKKYNGVDGNSPTAQQSPESYPTTATPLPDVEDINQDNTLSEEERYYQYRIQIRKDKMVQGENHITDVYEAPVHLKNGTNTTVKWYQFRIPVSDPDKVIGQIQDFTSIRFMRMFMKNFDEPAVLRFATLELVRNEWRKFTDELLAPGEYIPNNGSGPTSFDVSTVNIEENGKRQPIPYSLPAGIVREINYASINYQQLNEQSLSMKVCDLQDGDARAVYKTADFDFRRYKTLKMFIHAEQAYEDKPIADGDLHFFIRLGTDFTQNYYEYDIPLHLTPWYTKDTALIWPTENEIALQLQKFLNTKQARNIIMRENPNGNVSLMTPFIQMDGANKITVVGTPTLSSVKTIMMGIRNPKAIPGSSVDDGLDKCVEVWANELRVTDFDEHGGWAANTVISADLADLGNVVLAGNISTAGFGSIEQKINERQQENIYGYDFATNLELGKFFPEKSGIRIPMHYDVSEQFRDPEFNPVNPDIKYKDDLSTFKTKAQRDSVKAISTDYTKRTSFNLMNVKKMRTGTTSKPHIYDIENFDFTYQYSQQYHRNIDIEYDDKRIYRGAVGYNYTKNPKNYKPFSKVSFLRKHRSLALIRDFNFNLLPKQLGFRTNIDRMYNENLMRKKTKSLIIINPTYVKTFNWNRNYNFRYDFSRSLKLDYTAVVQARIDEPAGIVDKGSPSYADMRDSTWKSISDFGRTTNFNQNYNVNYAVPINKIPILSWVNLTARYGGTYRWTAAPLSTTFLGNSIENSNKIQVNATGNMVNFYNKIKYLKKINDKSRRGMNNNRRGMQLNLPPAGADNPDSTKAKKNWGKIIFDASLRTIMMVRNVSFSYTESNGTLLPGFNQSPGALGNNWSSGAPGLDFIFGSQVNIAQRAAENNWITQSQQLNNPSIRKHTENLNGRVSIEPVPQFKIEVTFLRNFSSVNQEYWRYDTLSANYAAYTPTQTGAFSMSYNTWRTSFAKDDSKTNTNKNFENFKDFLLPLAQRLAEGNPYWNGTYTQDTLNGVLYPDGYSRTSREVMMYSFLAAYSGQNPDNIPLTPFPKIPKPNWRITYNGLTKIDFIDRWFKTITLSHAYSSTYSVGGYTTNVQFKEGQDGYTWVRDQLGDNYIPRYDMNMISVNEQYSPLINLDMTLENSLIMKVAIRKSRNIAMSFSNNQITEINSDELIIGTGYRFKQVPLSLKLGGGQKTFKSDINLKLDFSIRKNKTVLRKLIEDIDQISQGQSIMSINFSADYQFSRSLTFRAFYDQVVNNPFISAQYPSSNIKAGISLRFTLAQ
jgi:cell surface protein SprA